MFKKILFASGLALALIASNVCQADGVPKYFNYQSLLYDDGGNPLPDGTTKLTIRVLDQNMTPIFEETQDAQVVSGVVSVLVGNGIGGLDDATLYPSGAKYLEVQADSYPPEGPMEIVSVPYSTYADVALQVVPGSVGATAIQEKSIMMKHLSDELVSQIGVRIVGDAGMAVGRSEFDSFKSSVAGGAGAKQIGVTPDFNYSSATNVENVLKDLDLAIKKRDEDVKFISTNVASIDKNMNDSFVTVNNKLDGDIRSVNDRVTAIGNEMNSDISSVNNRITTVESRSLYADGSKPMTGKLVLNGGTAGDPAQVQGSHWNISMAGDINAVAGLFSDSVTAQNINAEVFGIRNARGEVAANLHSCGTSVCMTIAGPGGGGNIEFNGDTGGIVAGSLNLTNMPMVRAWGVVDAATVAGSPILIGGMGITSVTWENVGRYFVIEFDPAKVSVQPPYVVVANISGLDNPPPNDNSDAQIINVRSFDHANTSFKLRTTEIGIIVGDGKGSGSIVSRANNLNFYFTVIK